MKALNITSLVLCVLMIPFPFLWAYGVTRKALFADIGSFDSYHFYNRMGGIILAVYFCIIILSAILSMIRVPTMTMKVMGILSLVFGGIGFMLALVTAFVSKFNFLNSWPVYSLLALILLGFSIPSLVQALRKRS